MLEDKVNKQKYNETWKKLRRLKKLSKSGKDVLINGLNEKTREKLMMLYKII